MSGQLEAETYALGQTFIHLVQHLEQKIQIHLDMLQSSMIEPEMAFYDLNDNMDLAESF